jgi:protein-disulfide isomerase
MDYIDPGKDQMFFSNYQFIGPDSITAGMAGEAIYKQNKDAFWKYYDAIYTNQKEESQIWATPEFIIDLVKKHVPGVDATKLSQDLKNKTYQKEVEADNQLAKKSGVTSVPAIFVNGKQVEDSLNYEAIKKAIDEELKK